MIKKYKKKYKVNPKIKGLAWKRKGRMMSERRFYGSSLHFHTEASYPQYKKAFKERFGK